MTEPTPFDYLRALVYAEAANQPLDVQLMVIDSVYNRLRSGLPYLAGKDIKGTIEKPHQYATGARYRRALKGEAMDDPDFLRATQAVRAYDAGQRPTVKGVTHFHSYKGQFTPYWSKKIQQLGKMGDFWVFKEGKSEK